MATYSLPVIDRTPRAMPTNGPGQWCDWVQWFWDIQDAEAAIKMAASGATCAEIARHFRVSVAEVVWFCERNLVDVVG